MCAFPTWAERRAILAEGVYCGNMRAQSPFYPCNRFSMRQMGGLAPIRRCAERAAVKNVVISLGGLREKVELASSMTLG